MGQGGEGLPGQDREDQSRRRTGRLGEGLDDGTGGCTYRSPSEARAEEPPCVGVNRGRGRPLLTTPEIGRGKISLGGGLVF